ncbi:MAG: cupredoxin domain-containing protein [bacterium]|nr:cupredoxin domain-containing protein [bacterium]
MGKAVALIVVIILLVGGIFIRRASPTPQVLPTAETTPSPAPEATQTTSSVKEFVVTGSNFTYSPNTISVKKGDKVKIIFKNADGFHDFKIDEYGVFTQKIGAGKEETIQFVADKAGSFEYYCSIGSHRQMGMKGTLTVSE